MGASSPMELSIDFSEKELERLIAISERRGTTPEILLRDLALELIDDSCDCF